jgi:DNA polymerase-3 subunit gamma/tau
MLSPHAFNALLKLIEEPPDHVVFILATTDTHRVPPTIISRTQRYDFRRLPTDVIAAKLTRITDAEGVEADAAALELIARLADGGMRDAESLLDQVMAYAGDHLGEASVRDTVGLAEDEAIGRLLDALVEGRTTDALQGIAELSDAGRDLGQVAQQLETEGRRRLLASPSDPALARRLAAVLRSASEAGSAGAREGRARLQLELLALDGATVATEPATKVPAPPVAAAPPAPSPKPVKPTPPPEESKPVAPTPVAPTPVAPTPEAPAPAPSTPTVANGERPTLETIRARWGEVVELATPAVKPLVKECRPYELDGARLTLAFPEGREFLRGRVAQRAKAIEDVLGQMFGSSWAVECVAASVDLEPLSVEQALAAGDDPEAKALLERTLEITGGQLVDAPEVRT